jgi:hypothetical protein
MSLWRNNEPEDYVRDAFVWQVLLYLATRHRESSIKTHEFVDAMQMHLRLLEIDGLDLKKYHFWMSDREEAIRSALSRAVISQVMFHKTANDGRHHLEHGFRRFAESEIKEHLDQEAIDAGAEAMELTAELYWHERTWERMYKRVEEYKRKKKETAAATK